MAADASSVVIRLAQVADVPLMQQIELDAGEMFHDVGLSSIAEASPPSPEDLVDHIEEARAWVAVDAADTPIAYAKASVVDGEAHLDQVSVARSAAGHGIGRRLIDEVCRWARSHGHDAVTLTTFTDVPFNGPLYERYGFIPLASDALGPELAAIRQAEIEAGIDVSPRVAMRLTLDPGSRSAEG